MTPLPVRWSRTVSSKSLSYYLPKYEGERDNEVPFGDGNIRVGIGHFRILTLDD